MVDTLRELIAQEESINRSIKSRYRIEKLDEKTGQNLGADLPLPLIESSQEFNFRMELDILNSDFFLIKLYDRYIQECEKGERSIDPDVDLDFTKHLVAGYYAETTKITEHLVKQRLISYKSGW
jgi:hypothetical protein